MGAPEVSDWSHTSSWPAHAHAVAGTRHFVRECLAMHGRDDAAFTVSLVVSELVTNVVVHADTPFSVTVASRRGGLHLTVRDGSSDLPVRTIAGPSATAGRGLGMVEMLSSAWGVSPERDGGKSVWASFAGGGQSRVGGAGVGEVGPPAAFPASPPIDA